jgi:hypothetical protein
MFENELWLIAFHLGFLLMDPINQPHNICGIHCGSGGNSCCFFVMYQGLQLVIGHQID